MPFHGFKSDTNRKKNEFVIPPLTILGRWHGNLTLRCGGGGAVWSVFAGSIKIGVQNHFGVAWCRVLGLRQHASLLTLFLTSFPWTICGTVQSTIVYCIVWFIIDYCNFPSLFSFWLHTQCGASKKRGREERRNSSSNARWRVGMKRNGRSIICNKLCAHSDVFLAQSHSIRRQCMRTDWEMERKCDWQFGCRAIQSCIEVPDLDGVIQYMGMGWCTPLTSMANLRTALMIVTMRQLVDKSVIPKEVPVASHRQ